MLEPKNDEEQNTRDATVHAEWGKSEHDRYVDILEQWKEQRAEIADLRRQLDEAKAKQRPDAEFLHGCELAQVRADIARTAAVVQALAVSCGECTGGPIVDEWARQDKRMMELLSRERELTAKTEPEGGDRG